MKSDAMIERQAGNVCPTEYDWKAQFDEGTDGQVVFIKMDAGKVRGLAIYAEELEMENKLLREALKKIAGIGDPDFPADDWQAEAERSMGIYMLMRETARKALG